MTALNKQPKQDGKKSPSSSMFDVEKIRLQLKRWQEKLLDMSKSNPLLGLNRARAAKLKIKSPDALMLFQKLVLEESELRMPFVKKVKRKKSDDLFNQEEPAEEKEIYEIEKGGVVHFFPAAFVFLLGEKCLRHDLIFRLRFS